MDTTTKTTDKPKTYWSESLRRAVTIPEDDERHKIDALLQATNDLLAAIQLSGVTPTDSDARLVWDEMVARTRRASAAFK